MCSLSSRRVEVEGPLAPVGLLDDRGHQVVVAGSIGHAVLVVVVGLVVGSCVVVVGVVVLVVVVGLDRRGAARSMGLPSGSTTSTCSSSHSSALRVRRSERTAGIWSLRSNCWRTFSGFWPSRLGQRLDLGVEVVVVDLDALGLGDGPQGEVGLDRLGRRLAQLLDEGAPGRCPVAARYCSSVHALGLEPHGEVLEPGLHLALDERLGRLVLDQLDQRLGRPSRAAPSAACTRLTLAMPARRGRPAARRRCRTPTPRRPTRRRRSGSTRSFTSFTSTRKSTGSCSVPGWLGGEGEDVADLGPGELLVELGRRSVPRRPGRGSPRR